jgi:hypothetical protein
MEGMMSDIKRTESDELGTHNIHVWIPTRQELFADVTICVYNQQNNRVELNIHGWMSAQEYSIIRDLISQVEVELKKLEDES